MLVHRRSLFAALLLLASSPWPARPFQGPSLETPLIEPRPQRHSGVSPDIAPSAMPPADLRSDSELVLVPAFVTNALGAPANQLSKDDFRVIEDGVEQPVTYFAKEDAPVSVGFLLDSSGSMRNKMRQALQATAAFFKTANKADEFFLVEFDEHVKLSVPFTSDANQLYKRVSHVRPIGRTSLLDAVHRALVEMKRAQYLRKALVIVSDGGDNRSRYNFTQIKNAMVESDVQLYSMGIFDPADQRKRTPEEKNGPQLLSELATESGGKNFNVDNIEDLPAISEQIGEELRSQYLLGYTPANRAHDGKYRRIKVTLKSPSPDALEVRYRQGYYAPAQ